MTNRWPQGLAAVAVSLACIAAPAPTLAADGATQPVEAPAAPPPGGKLGSLSFPSLKVATRSVVTYQCAEGRQLGVAYMNTDNQQSFAVIRLDGRHLVFVNVMSGSGARYAADKYVWWSKGDDGNLYDLTQGENAPPIIQDCKAVKP